MQNQNQLVVIDMKQVNGTFVAQQKFTVKSLFFKAYYWIRERFNVVVEKVKTFFDNTKKKLKANRFVKKAKEVVLSLMKEAAKAGGYALLASTVVHGLVPSLILGSLAYASVKAIKGFLKGKSIKSLMRTFTKDVGVGFLYHYVFVGLLPVIAYGFATCFNTVMASLYL